MKPKRFFSEKSILTLILLGGMAFRLWGVTHTWDLPAHPDLYSFHPRQFPFTHPFDTSPREPLFVWWLWFLSLFQADTTGPIRLLTSFWFLPNGIMVYFLARRALSPTLALVTTAGYAFLPGQIQSDTLGLRHLMETTGILGMTLVLFKFPRLETPRALAGAALGLAGLVLTRITFAGPGGLLLGIFAARGRSWRPLFAGLPALLLLGFHLINNKTRHGDLFYSVNLHSYWYANIEFVGKPGFHANEEERLKSPHRKSLTYREWAFGRHTLWEYFRDTLYGLRRFYWDFPYRTYFKAGFPGFVTFGLLMWSVLGWVWAWGTPSARWIGAQALLWVFPYAFVGHIFWAGRFFVPYTPLLLSAMTGGAAALVGRWRLRRPGV